MVSSQLVLLLAGAALSVNAQDKVTLYNFMGLPLDEQSTATQIASNSVGATYVFACPTAAIGSAVSSALGDASSIGGAAGSLVSSAAAAGASAGSSVANDIKSQISNINLTPIPKPTNKARDLRLLPIPRPSKAARDLRLTPIPKPTQFVRRELPDLSIPCVPYTVVQGSEVYGVKASITAPIKFYGEFNATWKGDIKSADKVTGTFTMGGDVTVLDRSLITETAAPSEVFDTPIVLPVVTASPTSSGSGSKASGSSSGSPSGSATGTSTPAKASNPAAAGPLPTGTVAYLGAVAGIFGAVLAL